METDPLDPEYVNERLSKPPFVSIPGVVNIRDLGSYPSTTYPGRVTRPRLLYRSAEISNITEEGALMHSCLHLSFTGLVMSAGPSPCRVVGKARLKELGITKVFDLRSDPEIERYKTPCPDIDGVEIVRLPIFRTEDYSPEMMAKRYELYASGKTEAFMELYSQIMDHGGPAFGVIFRHVRDKPTEGCIFHCTAGKDRTGVVAALFLKLAGVDDAQIAEDYALTRVGREPARQMVMARLARIPMFASNTQAALNMLTSRSETMLSFLELLQKRYGGIENYLKQHAQLSDEDIDTVRNNLLIPQSEC